MDFIQILGLTIGQLFSPFTIAYVLCALGLAVHFGYTGLMNFGQVGFMAAGAYGVGVSVFWLGWNFWVGLIFVFVYAGVLALLLGLPTLRLRADYLGLVGDSADGFPGLPGWGAKSAAAVLSRYGRLEDVPHTTAEWDVPGLRGADKLCTTLRERFDYVLASQRGGDCPADTKSAAMLARRLLAIPHTQQR